MPYEYQFPDPRTADSDGLLAAGGDLSVTALITAYSKGIFPWYDDNSPILWWSPDPRLVLFPQQFRTTDSLRQRIRNGGFEVKTDTCFEEVIGQCARVKRNDQDGTWITRDMMNAYITLHREGMAHSFETFQEGKLVGGLYGVSLGRAFFGESMFHTVSDASKIALHSLVNWCLQNDFHFIDAQQSTSHLKSMGAEEISRDTFLCMLDSALRFPTQRGKWDIR
jgi:leucyl/phenylalanyl-tRNA--protein transferase